MRKLSRSEAVDLSIDELLEHLFGILEPYRAPQTQESRAEEQKRLERSLDELPDIYAWLLELKSFFAWWTDRYSEMVGQKNEIYREFRARRDIATDAASAAKLRYDGASRKVTGLIEFGQASKMPRSR